MKHGKMHHMEIHPTEDGGHIVEMHMTTPPTMEGHRMASFGERKVEKHVFGKGDGPKMMAHVSENCGMKGGGKMESKEA